eukprot:955809-Rhodomonas_salina.1
MKRRCTRACPQRSRAQARSESVDSSSASINGSIAISGGADTGGHCAPLQALQCETVHPQMEARGSELGVMRL